jgi:serine protease AprX
MMQTAGRRRPLAALAVLAAALSWMIAPPVAGSPTGIARTFAVVDPALDAVHGTVGVIVQGTHSVESSVRQMGGRITHNLPLIGGFSARVPARDIPRISQLPGAQTISLDRPTHVQSAMVPSTSHSTSEIPSVYKKVTHGDSLNTAGAKGQGVTVALIDTGVSPVPDVANALVPISLDPLGTTTKPCVNFTNEPDCTDSYGHGTFMAGLIVGDGTSSNGKYVGMAPRAKLISLKIAGASGASDVSTIIAAIQWVVSFQTQYNIRVLNLSLGTDSTQSYHIDPLDFAVERAWSSGIVVNVAASNRGPAAHTISDPANDPFVITVGATDDKGTCTLNDDILPDFSGRGPTATDELVKPDVAAPGAHLVSLVAPGSAVATNFPAPASMTAGYHRGSGTSMANAVVSGLVAQLLSAEPTATPDRVKYQLMASAHSTRASHDPLAVGVGVVDGWAALNAGPGVANVGVQPGLGTGSLAASRGTVGVVLDDSSGTVLNGSSNLTSQLETWNPQSLLSDPWTGGSWWGGSWWGGSWWGDPAGGSWWGGSWWGGSWWGGSWWGGSWWGGSWWGASMDGVPQTEDYGGSWWGGSWWGAWDQA